MVTDLQSTMAIADDRQAAATAILLSSTVVDAEGNAYIREGTLSEPVALHVPAGQPLQQAPEGLYVSGYAVQTYGRLFPQLQAIAVEDNTVTLEGLGIGTTSLVSTECVARGVPVSREMAQLLAVAALGEPVQAEGEQQVFAARSEIAAYRLRKMLSVCGLCAEGETVEIPNAGSGIPKSVRRCVVVLGPQTMANVEAVGNQGFSANPLREDVVALAGDTLRTEALNPQPSGNFSQGGVLIPELVTATVALPEQVSAPDTGILGRLILPGTPEAKRALGEDAVRSLPPALSNAEMTTTESGIVVVRPSGSGKRSR